MVEWKELGSISEIGTGSNNREDSSENGLYPFFVRSKDILKIDHYLFDEEAILIPGEGGIGDIFHYINGKYGLHQRTYRVHPNSSTVNGRYLYYYLFENFKTYINKKSFKATATSIRKPMLTDFPVAIPPLNEQNRIVDILDIFTSSINNLDKQIEQRQKQYEYYRNKLLSFEEGEEGVEWKKSSEICEVSDYVANGSFADLRNNVTYKSEIDYALLVRTTDLAQDFKTDKIYIDKHAYAFLEKSRLFGGEIIINNIGAGVGKTFLCPERKERMCLGPNSIMVSTPNNRFYYYWFCSKFGQEAMMKVVSPGAMPKFNKTGFKTILLPIIPTEKMSKIVRTLDTFEFLLTNLKKERELRQKQYEYYREKLLTFA